MKEQPEEEEETTSGNKQLQVEKISEEKDLEEDVSSQTIHFDCTSSIEFEKKEAEKEKDVDEKIKEAGETPGDKTQLFLQVSGYQYVYT